VSKGTIPAYFLYRDALEAQCHVRERRLGWATSDSGEDSGDYAGNRAEMCN